MSKKVTGTITITSLGSGYLKSDELEEDVKIDASLLNTALHKDEVEVALLAGKEGEKQYGEVVKVIERAKTRFVGTIEQKKGEKYAFLIPDDQKMYVDIFIPNNDIKSKTKALVEIVKWDDSKKNPEGKVIQTIGKKGDNDAELHSIVLEKGLSIDFPGKVKGEAEKIKEKTIDIKNRRDFRNVTTFTIDPEDAKDFDDALSFVKIENGLYEIGVHIADVSYYVKEGTKLDEEARKRAFSIYLVDRTIPMLPEVLSNGVCSLRPNEDRATFSAVFKMKKDGTVVDTWFGETVICSDRRFTYKEAQNILDDKEGEFYEELSTLAEIAKKLQEGRQKDGALRIEDDELFFKLDKNGKPISVYRKEHLFTHNLIEEFMVLANRNISKKFNTLYRVHEKPDRDMINNLLSFLLKIGHKIVLKGKEVTSAELNELFEKVKGKDEEFLVKTAVLRSMCKAEYSTKNKKHFGLAAEEYTHFTSPIRRYADLLVHRIVKKKLRGEKVNPVDYEKVAREISLTELDVLDAERSSISYKQVEYMLEKVGETFNAIISGVTSFGIFVQEIETKAEGMVSIRDMDDDYYMLDEETYSLIGSRKKKRYTLGSKVKVKLAGGSLESRRLDFIFPK
jgi:ribonuclease R